MDLKEIESAMEGILFAAGEPVGVERICLALEIDRATADAVAQKLMDAYSYERRGIRLIKLDSSYQLCSAPEYAELIRKTFESRRPAKLSPPALEVLSVIAYYQPTTRAYVDQIRGVDSSYTVSLLLDRELLPRPAGRRARNTCACCVRRAGRRPGRSLCRTARRRRLIWRESRATCC